MSQTPRIPEQHTEGPYRIALVCLGNICRSPVADVVLTAEVAEAGLAERVRVESAGTGDWHVGRPMDPRAAASLREVGHDPDHHRARQYDEAWPGAHDLVLAMDDSNLADLRDLARRAGWAAEHRIRKFGDFDPVEPGSEVPDPYYGGEDGFARVMQMVRRTSTTLVAELARALDREPGRELGRP